MDKERVIQMRTALKGNKNLPLTVFLYNAFKFIDESAIGHFTIWDDENGYLYEIAYPEIVADKHPGNIKNISIFVTDYEYIQHMSLAKLPLSELDSVFGSIEETGKIIKP